VKIGLTAFFGALMVFAVGCGLPSLIGGMQVDVTKTAKGLNPPSKPDDIEILMLRPTRDYVELGTVSVHNCPLGDKARMHNALRAKTASLGADAVVLQNSGIYRDGDFYYLWATGAAIKYIQK